MNDSHSLATRLELDEMERIAENWSGPTAFHIESASVEDRADVEIAMQRMPALLRLARALDAWYRNREALPDRPSAWMLDPAHAALLAEVRAIVEANPDAEP